MWEYMFLNFLSHLILIVANLFIFAYIVERLVTNEKKIIEFSDALIYSAIFSFFYAIWLFATSVIFNWRIILFLWWSLLWGLAFYIYGRYIKQDEFSEPVFIMKAIWVDLLFQFIIWFILWLIFFFVTWMIGPPVEAAYSLI